MPRLLILCCPVPIRSAFSHRFKWRTMLSLVLIIFLAELGRLWVTLSMYTITILIASPALVSGLVVELLRHLHAVNPLVHT